VGDEGAPPRPRNKERARHCEQRLAGTKKPAGVLHRSGGGEPKIISFSPALPIRGRGATGEKLNIKQLSNIALLTQRRGHRVSRHEFIGPIEVYDGNHLVAEVNFKAAIRSARAQRDRLAAQSLADPKVKSAVTQPALGPDYHSTRC
jgi:hypothetical protein